MPVAYGLIDEINLLHGYYQFKTIELQIDSPGGSADALHYLLHSLAPWRNGEGLTLRTVALTEAASAAALLLSFGTLGHRCASAHSRLLYHSVRAVQREGAVMTVPQLRFASRQLEDCERGFLDLLVDHVLQGGNTAGGMSRAAYRKKLQRLFRQDRFISAGKAQELGLIDKIG